VPEYLVGYRQNRTTMSLNVDGMAASFAVFASRARQRNRDLPAAAFRWSGGYFYMYLVDKCFAWKEYAQCLRYLKHMVLSNPVLFLKLGVYRTLARSLFYLILRPPSPVEPRDTDEPEKKPKLLPVRKLLSYLNSAYWYFEGVRWSEALHDGAN
jgi:hypothetical protein